MSKSKHAWIEEVFRDIIEYARQNDLPRIKNALESASLVAETEIREADEETQSTPSRLATLTVVN